MRRVGKLPNDPFRHTPPSTRVYSWKVSKSTELSLSAQNLFDPRHPEWGGPANRAEIERAFFVRCYAALATSDRSRRGAAPSARCSWVRSVSCCWCSRDVALVANGAGRGGRGARARVKAALLYRFVNYVDWQEAVQLRPNAPFHDRDRGRRRSRQRACEFASGRTLLNRPLSVRKVRAGDLPRDAQVVFIGKGEASQLAAVIRSVPSNILIVDGVGDGLQHGSIINFIIVEGQVRFEISLDAARRRHIHLSSRLLSVAHNVQGALP